MPANICPSGARDYVEGPVSLESTLRISEAALPKHLAWLKVTVWRSAGDENLKGDYFAELKAVRTCGRAQLNL
jgi:hypothetical protein